MTIGPSIFVLVMVFHNPAQPGYPNKIVADQHIYLTQSQCMMAMAQESFIGDDTHRIMRRQCVEIEINPLSKPQVEHGLAPGVTEPKPY